MDVVIIGGGPAGLQAALTLGRMHRHVLLLDSGAYRNAPAEHMHNFVTHDGLPPAEFRAAARADLSAYDSVTVREASAQEVRRRGDRFETRLDDGSVVSSAAVVLATGVRDVLPEIPGVAELFGTLAHHCPFCHGHELAGGTVGIQGGPRVGHLAPMLGRIAAEVVVFAHDWEPTEQEAAAVAAAGARLVTGKVLALEAQGDGGVVRLTDGSAYPVDGFFVASAFEQSAPFAAQLGLTVLDSGCVEVDLMGRASEPGVYAAGDLAHHRELPMPMASVLVAAAAGQVAASACVADMLASESARG